MKTRINIEDLVVPIEGDNPSGEDLRYSGAYDRIREARRADDPMARGEWEMQVKTADWKSAMELCIRALTHKSKDLQIAAWLTEAWLNLDGYPGLASGLMLIVRLIEKYWETLYPPMEDGDLEYRIGPLSFLNEKLPDSVYRVPVCDPVNTRGYPFYAWLESQEVGFDQGLEKEQKKQREMLIADGKVSGEAFTAAVTASPIGYYKDCLEYLELCRLNLEALDDMINKRFTNDPPGLSRLSESVDSCYHLIARIFKDKQKSEVLPDKESDVALQTVSRAEMARNYEDSRDEILECFSPRNKSVICDNSADEDEIWRFAVTRAEKGELKAALDQILAAACQAPSVREKNRFLLLLSKLCLKVDRHDLARPMAEKLYALIDTLKLDQWEHPAWIADVIETLYRCLRADGEGGSELAKQLFEKLCTLNVTKAALYRHNCA